MTVSTKLSVAVHIMALIEINREQAITSEYIAASVHTNPVVIRRIMSQLKKSGLLHSSPGISATYLLKPSNEISLYDIYKAVEGDQEIFNIHKNPNPDCIVGRNIQAVLNHEFNKAQLTMEAELKHIYLSEVIQEIKEREKKL